MASWRTSGSKSKSSHPPPHWPPDIQFITELVYHSSVSASVRAQLTRGPALSPSPSSSSSKTSSQRRVAPSTNPANPSSLVAIRRIADPSHPAHGQHGLFALRKLLPHAHVLDYLGEVHCDVRPQSDYDLALVPGVGVGVDAAHAGNAARFVNDFRGVRARPNALFEERWTERGELRMAVWVGSEGIRKGEEIVVSYGKGWWRARAGEADEEGHGEEHVLGGLSQQSAQ